MPTGLLNKNESSLSHKNISIGTTVRLILLSWMVVAAGIVKTLSNFLFSRNFAELSLKLGKFWYYRYLPTKVRAQFNQYVIFYLFLNINPVVTVQKIRNA